MAGFKDYFSGGSVSYRDYRPHYPEELFEHLADIAPSRSTAWDCATGNGQTLAYSRVSNNPKQRSFVRRRPAHRQT